MKKTLLLTILLTLTAWAAGARDWTYSTNLFAMYDYTTNVFYGDNPSGTDTNRDTWLVMVNKLNHNDTWLERAVRTVNSALTNFMATNPPSSGGSTNTIQITNTVTAYNLSNAWLGSQRYVSYTTNYMAWGASNYLGRVAGIYMWRLDGGTDGGNPPMPIPMRLVGSYNGSNSWFTITNGFQTTNTISVAALTNGLSARGQPRTTLGNCTLYTVDKPELLGRDNYGFGQNYRFENPVNNDDAATKGYTDTAIAIALNGQMTTYTTTNDNAFHTDLKVSGERVFGVTAKTDWAYIAQSYDGSSVVIAWPLTNFSSGYNFMSASNLDLGMLGFTTFTNYTVATNGSVVEFTVPVSPGDPQRYFQIKTYSSRSMQFDIPTGFAAGTIYPSNTWNLASITNGLRPGDIVTVNSNGLKLVDVWMSNSVPILKPRW